MKPYSRGELLLLSARLAATLNLTYFRAEAEKKHRTMKKYLAGFPWIYISTYSSLRLVRGNCVPRTTKPHV
ncbi:hypothetical protein F5Y13DRAFT_175765 [Hypoxylon sp. FL1857]|nr:hypothetical protein F5Y13DRAFT_175765 [Hypoxylon sp. FL1857]